LDTVQGETEQVARRTKMYCERVAQVSTQQCAKSAYFYDLLMNKWKQCHYTRALNLKWEFSLVSHTNSTSLSWNDLSKWWKISSQKVSIFIIKCCTLVHAEVTISWWLLLLHCC